MQTVKVTLNVEIDSQQVEGYPIIKQLSVDELQSFNYEKVTGGGYVAAPISELSTVQLLLLRPSQAVTVRLNNQSDGGIPLAANGVVLIAGATIDTATLVSVNNASGSTAIVKGMGAGT